jgi:hypothetical protein
MALLNIFTGASSRALGFSNAEPPSAPTISTTKTATTITVTYTLNSGAFPIQTTQYKLDSGAFITITGGSFTLTGLSVNTSYTITMRSTDLAGQTSLESSSVVVTNTETAPSAPASVTASSSSSTTLSINFTAATAGTYPIASYQYLLYTGGSPVGDWATTPTGPGETFIRSSLTADATYTVYVRAIASVTTTPSSNNLVTAQVNPETPAAPALSFASTSSSDRANAFLSWGAVSYATTYHVYRNNAYYAATSSTAMTVAVSPGSSWIFHVFAGNRLGNFSNVSNFKYMTTGQTNVEYTKRNNSIRYVADPTFNYGGDAYNSDVVSTVTLPNIPTNDPNTAGYIYINSMGATFAWMQAPGIAGTPSYTTSKYSAIYSFAGSGRTTAWKTDATLSGNGWGSGFNTTNISGTNAINKALGDNYFCYISTGGTALSGKRFSVAALGASWSSLSSAPDPNDATQSYGTLIGYNAGSFETVYAYALIMSSLYVEGYQTTATTYA